MRASTLSLVFAAALVSAQNFDYYVSVVIETATNKKCAPFKNTTLTFEQSIEQHNTDGNMDRVVGLYVEGKNQSICLPFKPDGTQPISSNGQDYFGYDSYMLFSPPVQLASILCGLE
ncbi:hypothetical protein F5Y17DRAFT_430484 [Xylariaceae sp. FL0594]|nr:hypothetical protein F5Y17DRAFT_430484 [Xylariaceae sp. FL0594]